MNVVDTLFLAGGLAMDAFAVSLANGMCSAHLRAKDAFKTGAFFGGFQALMPVLGFLLGSVIAPVISAIDHWIALFLLSFIGIQMIRETFKKEKEETVKQDWMSNKNLLLCAVATSIDALVIGVMIALIQGDIWYPSLMIGGITFALSTVGVFLGRRLGTAFERGAGILGGSVLILLGVKIFLEHMGVLGG